MKLESRNKQKNPISPPYDHFESEDTENQEAFIHTHK